MANSVVISFYNTPSGLYSWWDSLATGVAGLLSNSDIDNICFFREFTKNTVYPKDSRNIANQFDLNSTEWLKQHIEPIINRYEKVIIHTHSFYPPTKLKYLLDKYSNTVWCATEHRIGSSSTSLLKRAAKSVLRYFNYLPKHYIAVSKAGYRRNRELFGLANQHLAINGIDLNKFQPSPMPSKEQTKTGIYLGRIDEKKGVWLLLGALKRLVKCKKRTDFRFKIVGGNDLQQTQLRQFVSDNDLEAFIEVIGHVEDPKQEIINSNFMIVPTVIEEALSLAALEARFSGRPVIYSNKGGLPETMVKDKTGIMISELSVEGVCQSIADMLDSPLSEHGISAQYTGFDSGFNQQRMLRDYQNIYNMIFISLEKDTSYIEEEDKVVGKV